MNRVFVRIAISITVSAGIYLLIAIGLVASDQAREPSAEKASLAFDDLATGAGIHPGSARPW